MTAHLVEIIMMILDYLVSFVYRPVFSPFPTESQFRQDAVSLNEELFEARLRYLIKCFEKSDKLRITAKQASSE